MVALIAVVADCHRVPPGIYHVGGGEVVSWREFADAIFAEAQRIRLRTRQPVVRGIATADYATAAKRPLRAVLAPNRAFYRALRAQAPDWRVGLRTTLSGLK